MMANSDSPKDSYSKEVIDNTCNSKLIVPIATKEDLCENFGNPS